MIRTLLITSAFGLSLTGPVLAQSPRVDPTAAATAQTGTMTADQVGVQPLTGVSTVDYVTQAAASDLFEQKSGDIAADKAKRKDIRRFGEQMVKAHGKTTDTLKAALNNAQRKIAPPSDTLPPDKQAMIDQLKATPRGSAFDNLYLAQQLQAHQQAWALQKGYAIDGDDSALRQVAAGTVPVVEEHLSEIKALQAGS